MPRRTPLPPAPLPPALVVSAPTAPLAAHLRLRDSVLSMQGYELLGEDAHSAHIAAPQPLPDNWGGCSEASLSEEALLASMSSMTQAEKEQLLARILVQEKKEGGVVESGERERDGCRRSRSRDLRLNSRRPRELEPERGERRRSRSREKRSKRSRERSAARHRRDLHKRSRS